MHVFSQLAPHQRTDFSAPAAPPSTPFDSPRPSHLPRHVPQPTCKMPCVDSVGRRRRQLAGFRAQSQAPAPPLTPRKRGRHDANMQISLHSMHVVQRHTASARGGPGPDTVDGWMALRQGGR